jgi:hypothetical protein
MSFTEIELERIGKAVGEMCQRRSPVHLRDQLRTTFQVKGYDVTVYEERPRWDNPEEWSGHPVAKFKYIRKTDVWKLYRMRSDLKWYFYGGIPYGTQTLEPLVKEVDSDPHGAFFG